MRRPGGPRLAWSDVKAKLASTSRAELLVLVRDLYAAHQDNRMFLHARFGLEEDVLEPFKEIIDRWIWPDIFLKQDVSVSKAKQAISDYKKAVGEPAGLAELMVFYCEQAAGFSSDIRLEDESFLNSLMHMFEQALTVAGTLPPSEQEPLIARLGRVCSLCHKCGYGVGEDMDSMLARHTERAGRVRNKPLRQPARSARSSS